MISPDHLYDDYSTEGRSARAESVDVILGGETDEESVDTAVAGLRALALTSTPAAAPPPTPDVQFFETPDERRQHQQPLTPEAKPKQLFADEDDDDDDVGGEGPSHTRRSETAHAAIDNTDLQEGVRMGGGIRARGEVTCSKGKNFVPSSAGFPTDA